jgi:adenine specific DNA methylase Mod
MEETVGSLDKEQLTRLAQYFDEKVISSPEYKTACIHVCRPTYWNRCPTGESGRNLKQAEKTVTEDSSSG